MIAPRERGIAVHAVVLAAGGSTRLGRPKQLVQLGGQSLLRRAAETTLAARVASVTVIVGADAEASERELAGLSLRIVRNRDWQSGMGTSIRCAAEIEPSSAAGLLFVLCDQLYLTTAHLDALIATFEAGRGEIVASSYAGVVGVPALFSPSCRAELLAVPDAHGGRDLLRRHADRVEVVPFDRGERDLDTAEDLEAAVRAADLEQRTRSGEGSCV
jgi:molybdenum cofactor cytidylyltransferase